MFSIVFFLFFNWIFFSVSIVSSNHFNNNDKLFANFVTEQKFLAEVKNSISF